MVQARLFCEKLVKTISVSEGLEKVYPLKPVERIYKLYRQDLIPAEIYLHLDWIRKSGNKAAHYVKEVDMKDVLEAHKLLFKISCWYMEVYVSHEFITPEYKLPTNGSNRVNASDLDNIIKPYIVQTMQRVDEFREEFIKQLEAIKEEKNTEAARDNVPPQTIGSPRNTDMQTMKKHQRSSDEKLPLRKEKEHLLGIFYKNNFAVTYETAKSIELQHTVINEVVYLLDNRETSIVLHPETFERDDNLKSKGKVRSSTALKQFPKHKNNGQSLI
ncbi:uncharacterized protein DUF4145 [Neobacillus bataviensis]|uniref:Uncharacterized protein DUF4145 n=1 Tax=Neobacillus bataviensis TaxID=220685 RepID=A0A561D625_9BACI|nr:uncharacterized protein DUF4145 [Neobacillus bataviensis]